MLPTPCDTFKYSEPSRLHNSPFLKNVIARVLEAVVWSRTLQGFLWREVSRREAVVSSVTQECAANRHDPKFQTQPFSFSSCKRMLIPSLPRSHIPMVTSVVQALTLFVCVWRGLVRVLSNLAPSWPVRSRRSPSPAWISFVLYAAHSQMH